MWVRSVFLFSFSPSALFLVSSSAWDVRARWILGILMVLIGELWYFLTEQLLQVREGGDVEGVMAWGSLGVLGRQPVPRREPTRLVQTRVAVSRTLVTRFKSAPRFGFRSTSAGWAIQSHEAALVLAVAKTMMFLDFYFFPSKNIEVVGWFTKGEVTMNLLCSWWDYRKSLHP